LLQNSFAQATEGFCSELVTSFHEDSSGESPSLMTRRLAGLCAEHRNIDSDPRVWQGIFDYVIKQLVLQQPNFHLAS
jgi:hypothetical protein